MLQKTTPDPLTSPVAASEGSVDVSNNGSYELILRKQHEIWKEQIKKFSTDPDFALEYITQVASSKFISMEKPQLSGKKWGLGLTKGIFALFDFPANKRNMNLKTMITLLRSIALEEIKKDFFSTPLLLKSISLDNEFPLAYFPNGKVKEFLIPVTGLECTNSSSTFYPLLNIDLLLKVWMPEWITPSLIMPYWEASINGHEITSSLVQKLYHPLPLIIEEYLIKCNPQLKDLSNSNEIVYNTSIALFLSVLPFFLLIAKKNNESIESLEVKFLEFITSNKVKLAVLENPGFFYNNLISKKSATRHGITLSEFSYSTENKKDEEEKHGTRTLIIRTPIIIKDLNLLTLEYFENQINFIKESEHFEYKLKTRERDREEALAYFESLSSSSTEGYPRHVKKLELNQNKPINEEAAFEPMAAAASSYESLGTSSFAEQNENSARNYLKQVVKSSDIIPRIAEYLQDIKKGMEIRGKKPNFVAISIDNMKVIADFNTKTPVISIFNTKKMKVSDSFLERLVANKIDYYGLGRSGNKVSIDENDDILESHIKYRDQYGESKTIPATYYTIIDIKCVKCQVCYYDCDISSNEWHQKNFHGFVHDIMPDELKHALTHESAEALPQNEAATKTSCLSKGNNLG